MAAPEQLFNVRERKRFERHDIWERITENGTISAAVMVFAAIAAVICANTDAYEAIHHFLETPLYVGLGNLTAGLTVELFVNDFLMAIFFLLVGIELKYEMTVGELKNPRQAMLPMLAAVGGVVVPACIYLIFNHAGAHNGWAIPMATDIAFSLGVLSLLGKRVPLSLKIFLTAFAVVDDIGGILVIAIFYSSHVAYEYLLWAALLYVLLYFIGKKGATNKIFFLVVGVVIWYLFLQSGIHSTISGVILAFVIPAKPQLNVGTYIERIRRIISTFPEMGANNIVLTNQQIAKLKEVESASDRVISPLQSLEDNLHGAVNYLVLPLFAFVNAGVMFSGEGEVIGGVTLAVALGLLAGKFLGIYSFTWLAVKSGLTPMPLGMNWKNISGVALLGGIGFTVSLFIANLSFGSAHPVLLNQAKLGVLSGTVMAGILGYLVLHWVLPQRR